MFSVGWQHHQNNNHEKWISRVIACLICNSNNQRDSKIGIIIMKLYCVNPFKWTHYGNIELNCIEGSPNEREKRTEITNTQCLKVVSQITAIIITIILLKLQYFFLPSQCVCVCVCVCLSAISFNVNVIIKIYKLFLYLIFLIFPFISYIVMRIVLFLSKEKKRINHQFIRFFTELFISLRPGTAA